MIFFQNLELHHGNALWQLLKEKIEESSFQAKWYLDGSID